MHVCVGVVHQRSKQTNTAVTLITHHYRRERPNTCVLKNSKTRKRAPLDGIARNMVRNTPCRAVACEHSRTRAQQSTHAYPVEASHALAPIQGCNDIAKPGLGVLRIRLDEALDCVGRVVCTPVHGPGKPACNLQQQRQHASIRRLMPCTYAAYKACCEGACDRRRRGGQGLKHSTPS